VRPPVKRDLLRSSLGISVNLSPGVRIPNRWLALLSLAFNLPFALFNVQRTAFDTYAHIFLADHYRLAWWSLWEPRWYLGFSMASYPPLAHQLIVLLSRPCGLVIDLFAPWPEAFPGAHAAAALEAGYVSLLLACLALLPLAVRAFARIFVGPWASGAAGLFAVFLPAASLAAWSFGQLPTLMATGLLLAALARGYAWATEGRQLCLAQAVALAAAAAGAHHGAFLLVPFAGLAVAWRAITTARPASQSSAWRAPAGRAAFWPGWDAGWSVAARLAAWAALSAGAVAAVAWPFIAWSRGQDLQAPIYHASRANVLLDVQAGVFFFWAVYGPLLVFLPWALTAGWRARRDRLRPLLALFGLLFLMGLGGATPLPSLLFGPGWAWLTYDRFGLWAAICLLPFAGAAAAWHLGRSRGPGLARIRGWLAVLMVGGLASGWLAVIGRSQPPPVDMAALVQFLNQPGHDEHRYMTLGFGDQMALLSTLVPHGTPDGTYHTARQLPELRASGLGALDVALWTPQGLQALKPFLARAPQYGVRWIFVHHPAYEEALITTGWRYRGPVGNVELWDRPPSSVPAAVHSALPSPTGAAQAWAARWWGSIPLLALASATALLAAERRWPPLTRQRVGGWAAGARRAGWAATFVLLWLWWVHVAYRGPHEGVYFVYQSVMVFASDVAAAATLALWLLERALRDGAAALRRARLGPLLIVLGGLALVVASLLSLVPSNDRVVTLAVCAHLVLLGGWYALSVNAPPRPAVAARLFGGALVAQAGLAIAQAGLQSTAFLQRLNLLWPGALDAAVRGASVVETPAGLRWLRAYGSLPHPNILAGMLLAPLAAVTGRFMAAGGTAWLAMLGLGAAALVLTFSRAGWLAAAISVTGAAAAVWALAPSPVVRARAARAAGVVLASALFSLLPLLPVLTARIGPSGPDRDLEHRSVDQRVLLTRENLRLLAANPLLGVGAGASVPRVAALGLPTVPREPAHNVPLLIAAETGLPGMLALGLLSAGVGRRLWQRRRLAGPAEAALGIALIGIAAGSLFDHFWWSLPPARMALVTVLGLWVGWGEEQHGREARADESKVPPR
jgi:hypothetical protein